MTTALVRKIVDQIEKAGIKHYMIWMNNAYIINVNDSTQVYFDDANEALWYYRIPNQVTAGGAPLALECTLYEIIERICIPGDITVVSEFAKAVGLPVTTELTEWLKQAGNPVGLCPVQNCPPKPIDLSKVDPDAKYHSPSMASVTCG